MVWQTDTSAEAVKARAEEQLTAAMSSMVTVGNTEAEEAEARKREEKRKAKEEAARLVRPPCPCSGAVPGRSHNLLTWTQFWGGARTNSNLACQTPEYR